VEVDEATFRCLLDLNSVSVFLYITGSEHLLDGGTLAGWR